MAKSTHKGTELNNVSETWDQNERQRESGSEPNRESIAPTEAAGESDLDRVIKEEAAEYDNVNKEDRILGGERASLNDDAGLTDANQ